MFQNHSSTCFAGLKTVIFSASIFALSGCSWATNDFYSGSGGLADLLSAASADNREIGTDEQAGLRDPGNGSEYDTADSRTGPVQSDGQDTGTSTVAGNSADPRIDTDSEAPNAEDSPASVSVDEAMMVGAGATGLAASAALLTVSSPLLVTPLAPIAALAVLSTASLTAPMWMDSATEYMVHSTDTLIDETESLFEPVSVSEDMRQSAN